MKTVSCALIALATAAGTAAAGFTVDTDVAVTFAGSDLNGIVGTGIPNSNFVRAINAGEDIEIGLKAIERFVGDLPNTGDRYFADAGESDPGLSTWNYVLVANLGPRTIADLQINLLVDFDPAFGATDFVNVDITTSAVLGGFGSLSTFGDSQNLGFDFWSLALGAPPFDLNAPGEYDFVFTVTDPTNGVVLAEVTNVVEVVPAPAGAAAFAALGVFALRRRR